jgi:hypothetical protein
MPSRLAGRSARHLLLLLLLLAAAAALVIGCGGGGGGTAAPASAARSYAAGAISGFGSVIVNGVRFDDSNATITDDDGNVTSSSALELGMQVEVQGGPVTDDGTGPKATALAIRFGAAVLGPVSAVDTTAKTLVVLDQTVNVLDTTVIDASLVGGLAAVTTGLVLEVHGTRDPATGAINATRIEPEPNAPAYRVKGPIAGLDTTAHTFSIGGAVIAYGSVSPPPANLANGMIVAVRVQTAEVAGQWIATRILGAAPQVGDADRTEIEGVVTAFTSTASFSVNGIPVDASNAQFPEGTTGLVLGAHVEVHGTSANGVVTAASVEVETAQDEEARGFELHGQISAIDTTAQTFVLRGITVSYGGANVDFRKGTAAQLAVGVQVEVQGVLSADGTMLQATRISFGD